MIRVSPPMVKQGADEDSSVSVRVSSKSSSARAGARVPTIGPPELLPVQVMPEASWVATVAANELDALLVIAPADDPQPLLARLPERQRWQELNARSEPRPGTLRSTTLANQRQTLAVLGYMGAEASTF